MTPVSLDYVHCTFTASESWTALSPESWSVTTTLTTVVAARPVVGTGSPRLPVPWRTFTSRKWRGTNGVKWVCGEPHKRTLEKQDLRVSVLLGHGRTLGSLTASVPDLCPKGVSRAQRKVGRSRNTLGSQVSPKP